MKNILIVDDEKAFLLSLSDGLSSYATEFNVLTASNGMEAIEVLESASVDLVVTDLKMPVMDGFGLLAYIASRQLGMPIIVMTAFGTPDIEGRLQNIGPIKYLEKPLDFDVLANNIKAALKESAKGYLSGITLPTFLQLIEMEKKTCTLNIKSSGRAGRLFFRNGKLVDAEAGTITAEPAAYEMVCWSDAEIEMVGGCNKTGTAIKMSLNNLLIDACRIADEKNRDNTERGDNNSKLSGMEEYDDIAFDIAENDEPPAVKDAAPNSKEVINMSSQDTLKEFTLIEGFSGVGVFTPGGESLGMLASEKVNLKEIGVLANNVLMNAQKASLDMGTGRGQLVHVEAEHAHILVRCLNEGTDPLKSQPGKAHIHLVLILTTEGSIGLAKLKINKLIEKLADDFRV